MAVLETVLELQKKGYDDSAIVDLLKEKGIPPKEIMNALSQADVKSAVDSEKEATILMNEAQTSMQPSIMEQEAPAQAPVPQAQPEQEQEQYIYPTPAAYAPEQYAQYPQPQAAYQGYETETISELAEQIVIEKLSDTNKNISSLTEFRGIAEARIEDTAQRIRKIESTIENLQLSILNKIGGYGKNLDDIKTEMQAMQDTFSKTLNPLIDRTRRASGRFQAEQKEETDISQEEDAEKPARKSKAKDEFENYLR